MKEFITKKDYIEAKETGLTFVTISREKKKALNEKLRGLRYTIADNNRIAIEESSKVILNR